MVHAAPPNRIIPIIISTIRITLDDGGPSLLCLDVATMRRTFRITLLLTPLAVVSTIVNLVCLSRYSIEGCSQRTRDEHRTRSVSQHALDV